VAILAGACASDTPTPTPTPAPTGRGLIPTDDPDVGHACVLTHDSFDISTEVLDAFTDETGITIELVPLGDAGTTGQPGRS
jgi:hypothetical protein